MTNNVARSLRREARQLNEATVTRHLRRLAAAYPGFLFNYATLGRKGRRWTAERIDRTASGLSVLITADLRELHAALARDKARYAAGVRFKRR